MDVAYEFPSLMDDVEFLAELDKMEVAPPDLAHDRASRVALATFARKPMAVVPPAPAVSAPAAAVPAAAVAAQLPEPFRKPWLEPPPELLLRRDVDRFQLHPSGPASESEAVENMPASLVRAFLTILIGLSAGAISAALIFHDRVSWLLSLWSR